MEDSGPFHDAESNLGEESLAEEEKSADLSVGTLWYEVPENSSSEVNCNKSIENEVAYDDRRKYAPAKGILGSSALYMSVSAVGPTQDNLALSAPVPQMETSVQSKKRRVRRSPRVVDAQHRARLRSAWAILANVALTSPSQNVLKPSDAKSRQSRRRSRRSDSSREWARACFRAWWKWATFRIFAALAVQRQHERMCLTITRQFWNAWCSFSVEGSLPAQCRPRSPSVVWCAHVRRAWAAWRRLCAQFGAAGAERLQKVVWGIILLRLFLAWKIENLALKIRAAAFEVLACWAERHLASTALHTWRCAVVPSLRPFRVWAAAALQAYTRICRRFQARSAAQKLLYRSGLTRAASSARGWRRAMGAVRLHRWAARCAGQAGLCRWAMLCDEQAYMNRSEATLRYAVGKRLLRASLRAWYLAAEASQTWHNAAESASAAAATRRKIKGVQAWHAWASETLRSRLTVSERRAAAEERRCRVALLSLWRLARASLMGRTAARRPALSGWRCVARTKRFLEQAISLSLRDFRARARRAALRAWHHRAVGLAHLRRVRAAAARQCSIRAARAALARWERAIFLRRADKEVEAAAARGACGRLRGRVLRVWRMDLLAGRRLRDIARHITDQRQATACRAALLCWRDCAWRRIQAARRGWASRARRSLLCWWSAATVRVDTRTSLEKFRAVAHRAEAAGALAGWRQAARTRGVLSRCATLMCYSAMTHRAFALWVEALERSFATRAVMDNARVASAAITKRRVFQRLDAAASAATLKAEARRLCAAKIATRALRAWRNLASFSASAAECIRQLYSKRAVGILRASLIGWATVVCHQIQLGAATAAIKVLLRRGAARRYLRAMAAVCCAGGAWCRRSLRSAVTSWRGVCCLEKGLAEVCVRRGPVLLTLLALRAAINYEWTFAGWAIRTRVRCYRGSLEAELVRRLANHGLRANLMAWCQEAGRLGAVRLLQAIICRRFTRARLAYATSGWRYWTKRFVAAETMRIVGYKRLEREVLMSWFIQARHLCSLRAAADRCKAFHYSLRGCSALVLWAAAVRVCKERHGLCHIAKRLCDRKLQTRVFRFWLCLPRQLAAEHFATVVSKGNALRIWRRVAKWLSSRQACVYIMQESAEKQLVSSFVRRWSLFSERNHYLQAAFAATASSHKLIVVGPALRAWHLQARYSCALGSAAECFLAGRLAAVVLVIVKQWDSFAQHCRSVRQRVEWVHRRCRLSQMALVLDEWASWTAAGMRGRLVIFSKCFNGWKCRAGMQLYWRAAMKPLSGAYWIWLCRCLLGRWSLVALEVPSFAPTLVAAVKFRALLAFFCEWKSICILKVCLRSRGMWLVVRGNKRRAAASLAAWYLLSRSAAKTQRSSGSPVIADAALAAQDSSGDQALHNSVLPRNDPRGCVTLQGGIKSGQILVSTKSSVFPTVKNSIGDHAVTSKTMNITSDPQKNWDHSNSLQKREFLVLKQQHSVQQAPCEALLHYAPNDFQQHKEIKFGAAWLAAIPSKKLALFDTSDSQYNVVDTARTHWDRSGQQVNDNLKRSP